MESKIKTAEEIITEIYKKSITHIEGFEKAKLTKTSMLMLSEVLEAMRQYAEQFKPSEVEGVPSDEEIDTYLNDSLNKDFNVPYTALTLLKHVQASGAKWMRDHMLSLLAEKEKKIKSYNLIIKAYQAIGTKYFGKDYIDFEQLDDWISSKISELEAVKKELKEESDCVEHMKDVCDNYEKELTELKSHADKIAEALDEVNRQLLKSGDIIHLPRITIEKIKESLNHTNKI